MWHNRIVNNKKSKKEKKEKHMSNFETQHLECADCGRTFDFTAEDQEFYNEKGYSAPRRCPECRQARKNQSGRGGGGGRGGSRPQRQQYATTCSACGCETSVPFRPSGDRPVFCSDCYKKQQGY
jgi:CxxC-x17-CxxC domain-containing protein